MVNMLILAYNICLSWNPCNNYIVIKASVFYTTKPINPVICLIMNFYKASFPYHKALSWLMELKVFFSKVNVNNLCHLQFKQSMCIFPRCENTTNIYFIHPNQHNSYQLSYRNITHQQYWNKRHLHPNPKAPSYTDQFPSIRHIIHIFRLNTGSSCFSALHK